MAYYYEKMIFNSGKWFARLLIPAMNSLKKKPTYLLLDLQRAKKTMNPIDYRIITPRYQINYKDKMIVTQVWSYDNKLNKLKRIPTNDVKLEGKRYATQYDYDKLCFDNPDPQKPFDWNAEVYRAFISSTPGTYTTASNNDIP